MYRWLTAHICAFARLLAERLLHEECASLRSTLRAEFRKYSSELRARLPATLVQCLIVAEDHRFYLHGGLDPIAIGRCLIEAPFGRRMAGASTVEQQLVRTLTKRYERSLRRKLREILLASTVSTVIAKADVPGLYLSVAYMGWQMNGIKEACHRFGIALEEMTPRQAASLVARLKYPQPRECSIQRSQQIAGRANHILTRATRLELTWGDVTAEGAASATIYS